MRIETLGPPIFGMHRQGTDASDVSRRQSPADGVLQQRCAKALPLVFHSHGQPRQHHQRNRMLRQPLADALRCLLRAYLTHHQGVEANHPFRFERHLSAVGAGPLVGQGKANQETVQGFVATIKALQGLAGP